jgi:hypothetical protein
MKCRECPLLENRAGLFTSQEMGTLLHHLKSEHTGDMNEAAGPVPSQRIVPPIQRPSII